MNRIIKSWDRWRDCTRKVAQLLCTSNSSLALKSMSSQRKREESLSRPIPRPSLPRQTRTTSPWAQLISTSSPYHRAPSQAPCSPASRKSCSPTCQVDRKTGHSFSVSKARKPSQTQANSSLSNNHSRSKCNSSLNHRRIWERRNKSSSTIQS